MSDDDRPSGEPATGGSGERDLLGIGLAIYFVILIGIVGVMTLLLPALMPPA
jgi:hypothetical protein